MSINLPRVFSCPVFASSAIEEEPFYIFQEESEFHLHLTDTALNRQVKSIFKKLIKLGFPNASKTLQDLRKICTVINIHRKALCQQAAQDSTPVYLRADEKNCPRGIEFKENGTVLIHFNKQRHGDLSLPEGGFKRPRFALNIDTGKIIVVARVVKGLSEAKALQAEKFLYKEVDMQKTLGQHEGLTSDYEIVKVYGKGQEKFFLEMPFYEGGSLKRYLSDCSQKQVINILLQLFKAVEFLHSRHVAHRDIKPANVFLSHSPLEEENVSVYLGDTSFALNWDKEKILAAGSLKYMPPECVHFYFLRAGQRVKSCEAGTLFLYKMDLWAIGCIIQRFLGLKVHRSFFYPSEEAGSKVKSSYLNFLKELFPAKEEHLDSQVSQTPFSELLIAIRDDLMQFDPDKRLSMTEILKKYEESMIKLMNQ